MVTEGGFVKFYDNNPLSFPKLIGARKLSKWNQIVVGVTLMVGLVPVSDIFFSFSVNDLPSFFNELSRGYFMITILINVWALFSTANTETVGLEDFNSIDRALEITLTSQIDLFYPLFVSLVATQLLSSLRFVQYVDGFFILNTFITSLSIVQAVLMKHMVSKRVICIQEKAAEIQNVLEIVPTTRKVLNFNQKVNEVFSLRVASTLSTGLTVFLNCLLSHWRVYGLHKEVECFESTSPFFATLVQSHVITQMLFLAGISSKITSSVQSLSWETNRRISSGEHSMEHRIKLEVFMLEMAHTSTDFTAFELFAVDYSLITSIASFTISMMMIFIQFMT